MRYSRLRLSIYSLDFAFMIVLVGGCAMGCGGEKDVGGMEMGIEFGLTENPFMV